MDTGAKFATGQVEKCPTTNKEHLQYVLQFERPKDLSAIQKKVTPDHIEPTVDFYKAIDYCRKLDTRVDGPWTLGDEPTKGGDPFKKARNAIEMTHDEIMELKPHEYLIARKIRKLHGIDDEESGFEGPRKSLWIWGEPGAGKSRACYEV